MTKDKGNGGFSGESSLPASRLAPAFEKSAAPIVGVDVAKYQAWLDDANLSPEQKEEFLQALWSIVVMFVELGFGVHPLQEVWEQDQIDENELVNSDSDAVDSKTFDIV